MSRGRLKEMQRAHPGNPAIKTRYGADLMSATPIAYNPVYYGPLVNDPSNAPSLPAAVSAGFDAGALLEDY